MTLVRFAVLPNELHFGFESVARVRNALDCAFHSLVVDDGQSNLRGAVGISLVEETVPTIRASVEKLGLKFTDIKIILGSHAHGDNMDGDALANELKVAARDGNGVPFWLTPAT